MIRRPGMLTHLRIRNLALVADLTLEFRGGFNAITGETGAGKSILIGALNLLLGQRADRTLIRAGSDGCTVEGVLELGDLREEVGRFLESSGLESGDGGELVLKRTFTAAGANRQFVNGSPTTLQVLAELGDRLVDIHGPHDHQSLFQGARQLELLDAFAGLDAARQAFEALYDRRQEIEAAKAALVVDDATYARQVDLLRHQVHEIDAARLTAGEDETLAAEHGRARNAARLLELSQEAAAALSGNDEDSLLLRAGQLGRSLQELARLDPGAGGLEELHGQAMEAWRELQGGLSHYADRVDIDPARFQELEERMDLLHALRRKYGGNAEAILAFGERARSELAQLEGRDVELARWNGELEALEARMNAAAEELRSRRRAAIPKLARAVAGQLRDLGFKQSEFGIRLRPVEGRQRSGSDAVEFEFAPNPGEPARALRAIASSGEMARVMLALKTVLAAQDRIPVLVFDEVDANVGGETARAVGAKMRQIGRRRQVLCITHLAPVAAAGDSHRVVTKEVQGGRTETRIATVEGEARVAELARMLGGGAAARAHAESLLQEEAGR